MTIDETHTTQRPLWPLLYVYPAASALLTAAACPPLPLGFLGWVGLVPLLLSAQRLRGRQAATAGFVHGVVFYLATVYWIAWITPPGMIAAVLFMALWRALSVWMISEGVARFGTVGLWAAPLLWTAVEYVSALGDLGFPWAALGLTQAGYLPLIQYADVTGIYGVSFWAVMMNLAVLAALRRKDAASIAAVVVLVAAPLAHGLVRLREPAPARTIRVGLIQPDMAPVAKEYRGFDHNFAVLKTGTLAARAQGAELVVWPETAVPAYFHLDISRDYRERVQGLVDSLRIFLFTGGSHLEVEPTRKVFNSGFGFSPGGTEIPRYDKMKLVPFGERTPFPEVLPFLRSIQFSGGGFVAGNWDAGTTFTVYPAGTLRYSGLICFDSVFPHIVSSFVRRGADLLVVITNDGWFGPTSGPFQHAAHSVFRAVENRRSVARCANTGVSMFVDPYGRTLSRSGIFEEATLVADLPVSDAMSPYARWGDLFSQVCLLGAVGIVGMSRRARLRRNTGSPEVQAAAGTVARQGDGGGPASGSPASGGLEEDQGPAGDRPMPFLDHLEELRWRLIKALLGVAVGAALCGAYVDAILGVLTGPYRELNPGSHLVTLKPMGMFMVKLNIALVGGAFLALPLILQQIWRFVAPGLFPHERRGVSMIVASFTLCFATGVALAYFAVVPLSLRFLVGMTADTDVVAQFDIGLYIGFVLRMLVAFGLVFELPVATFFLAKFGLVTSRAMRAGRRYAIVGAFVLGAVLTPGPDPISQVLMVIPLILLYEASIFVARFARE